MCIGMQYLREGGLIRTQNLELILYVCITVQVFGVHGVHPTSDRSIRYFILNPCDTDELFVRYTALGELGT